MPSPKSKRTPPARNFRDYIFTREASVSSGLLKINPEEFIRIPGILSTGMADGDNNTDLSSAIEIGFKFQLGGVNYTHFIASVNGWMVLLDPASGAFAHTDIFVANDTTDVADNYRIANAWRANHLLLAPWFDDLRNLADRLDTSVSAPPYPITSQLILDLYEKGYWSDYYDDVLIANRDPYKYGVSYCRQERTPKGRRLVVQWNSTVYASPFVNSILRFEVAIYENGRIEFNYAPRSNFALYEQISQTNPSFTDPSSATIGIFMNGSSVWRFRDFSLGLGYRDSERKRYVNGGAEYDVGYSDTDVLTVPYNVNLKFLKHWPGQKSLGTSFIFQPPLNRRKVLPRSVLRELDSNITLPTVARTGDRRMGNEISMFDDRNSILFKKEIVNYPTTLPRFYADTAEGVSDRQDLFAGNFLVTGSVIKSNVEQFIGNKNKKYIDPFCEYKLFENDPNVTSTGFFATGTSALDVGEGFDQPLRSKTQIKLSFRVDDKTTMYGLSSSIYFYNSRSHRWQYPQAAASTADPENEIARASTDVDPSVGLGRIVEVDKGFNAYGISICSGSASTNDRNLSAKYNGTDSIFNSHMNNENAFTAVRKVYEKSLQNDKKYRPSGNEKFSIPINQPFLIEKAVIEIPIEAGPSWFFDKTQCFLPKNRTPDSPLGTYILDPSGQETGGSYRTNTFDIGGPGLTVSLFNDVKTGVSSNRLDLILTGTITHYLDNQTEIKLYDYELDPNEIWQIVPRGFNAYGTPSSIVKPTFSEVIGDGITTPIIKKDFFTGSVAVKCQAAISNGVIVRDTVYLNHADTSYLSNYFIPSLNYLFDTPRFDFDPALAPFSKFVETVDGSGNKTYLGFREKTIVGANNIGRGSTGVDPLGVNTSGRSIFGKELSTANSSTYDNAFYRYKDDSIVNEILTKITSLGHVLPEVYATQVVTRQNVLASPYLVFPGDKLTLSVSKTRPFCFTGGLTSGSLPFTRIYHDVKLNTGSINITLYGSLISNGKEYHDTLNQPLASDAVHELFIGGTK